MRRSRLASTIAASSLLVLLAGCGGGDDGGSDDTTDAAASGDVTVVGTEFAYDPAEVTVTADEEISLTLQNDGAVEHDITLEELDLVVYAAAGESATETVTIPAGTYEFHCSIPGHQSSGMEGTLTAS